MPTRSMIGTIEGSGVIANYCHYDGYPKGVGKTLTRYYKTPGSVLDLIKDHPFGIEGIDTETGEVIPFSRGRGIKKYASISDFMKESWSVDYLYLFFPATGNWAFYKDGKQINVSESKTENIIRKIVREEIKKLRS